MESNEILGQILNENLFTLILKIKKHVSFIREKITRAMVTKSNVPFTAKIYKSEKVWSFPQVEDQ